MKFWMGTKNDQGFSGFSERIWDHLVKWLRGRTDSEQAIWGDNNVGDIVYR